VKKLIYRDKFTITGRGQVYTINLKENGIVEEGREEGIDRDESWKFFPRDVPVEIDNQVWMISGIESFATFVVYDVGLLVRTPTEEERKNYNEQ